MGYNIKKWIPLWIKSPIAVFLQQIGKLPIRVVWSNVVRSYTQNAHCSEETRQKVLDTTHDTIYQYLSNRYGAIVTQISENQIAETPNDNSPIWVFWWQGKEHSPYIIQSCINNICKNAGHHPVHIVDKTNYQLYSSIPQHILKKFNDGKMSITHFSDYLRVNLLCNNGGLWIDGSIFVKQQIPEYVFSMPFWTIRNPGKDKDNISNWDWTIGVMGGWKNNVVFSTMLELLSCYWKDHDIPADYFVMDYMMKLIYNSNNTAREFIHAVEPSNDEFYYLQEHANQPLDAFDFILAMQSNTWLYKISWKGHYLLRTPQGDNTVYSQWQSMYGVSTEPNDES